MLPSVISLRMEIARSRVRLVCVAFCLTFCLQALSKPQASAPETHSRSKVHKKHRKHRISESGLSLAVVNSLSAPPLTPRQKLHLAFIEFANPFVVIEDAAKAQYYRATEPEKKIGYGTTGYARQFGAAYLDTVSASMFSAFLYPALLHQDPRYFRKGKGSVRDRLFYAVSHVFVARGDAGQQEFNWSQTLGGASSAALSSTYYPARERRGGVIAGNIGWSLLGDAGTNVYNEFWPDFSRWLHGQWRRIKH